MCVKRKQIDKANFKKNVYKEQRKENLFYCT